MSRQSKKQPTSSKWIQSNRLKHYVFAFLIIPAAISAVHYLIFLLNNSDYLNLIPENFTTTISFHSYFRAISLVFYTWFKLLIAAQSILLGLISLEVVRIQLESNNVIIKRSINIYNEFHVKAIKTNNWFKKKYYNLRSFQFLDIWGSILFIYIVIVIISINPEFSLLK